MVNKLKQLLVISVLTLAALSTSKAISADIAYSCTSGTTNNTCLVKTTATLNNEELTVEFNGGSLGWCNGWSTVACPTTGTVTLLNSEFTVQQLLDANVKFKTTKANQWLCKLAE
jgi:hypothetical protein